MTAILRMEQPPMVATFERRCAYYRTHTHIQGGVIVVHNSLS